MAYFIPIVAHLACYHQKMTGKQIMDRTHLLMSETMKTDDISIDD